MRTAVTGSVAIDHLATFPGSFGEQLIDGALDRISLSFLVNRLDVRYGGVAANITAGLGRLGQRPLLVAAAGHDFGEYRAWLEAAGVDTAGVLVDEEAHTARFWCTTDREQNQIASFHPGAMTSARRIELEHVLARAGRVDLVVIGPDDAEAMLRHTECCRGLDLAFAADPSQQLALLDGPAIRRLVDGARYLFTNEYEHALLLRKTGWGEADVRRRVGVWITTLGAAGVRIDVPAGTAIEVPAVAGAVLDPTGAGDGFRAGFLAARGWGLPYTGAARLGCAVATTVLETRGTADYELDGAELLARLSRTYGPRATAELAPRLAAGLAAGRSALTRREPPRSLRTGR
ncbi:adenosine kinase [Amycolatopsis bartoniae]|uniref:Kinase n=1 Tax=Amycolatopsis bartoniae TaxID=941986 RepID=A0A8H9IVU9_9PSEU|nr:carbohydrate kinase family protein [Amycolatopsis bartoniae]MBB2939820.1 adenosine kinase [Amycolatopsis bartoniae]TVT07472.1 carbohydrate kinase family protein [Amycolatopsis bartoniae]GHF54751.1 kinase [Amycolatopsis bartoniae]